MITAHFSISDVLAGDNTYWNPESISRSTHTALISNGASRSCVPQGPHLFLVKIDFEHEACERSPTLPSASTVTMTFPSLVGGFVLRGDFAPSIICAALYGILIPIFVYRFIDRRSRNTLLIGTASFAVERSVTYSQSIYIIHDIDASWQMHFVLSARSCC